MLLVLGRYDEAGEKFEAAATLAEGRYAQAQIRNKLGELAFKRGDMEHSVSCFESALQMLDRRVPRRKWFVFMLAVWEAFVQLLHTWMPRAFVGRLKREPNPTERLVLQTLSNLSHACWYCRSQLITLWVHLRNLNLAERYSTTPELGLVYAEHAPGMALVGMHRRAQRYAEKSLQLRQEFNDLAGQAQSLHYHGIVLYAKTIAPIGAVSAVRESSVIIASLIGILLFGERPWVGRVVSAVIVATGVCVLAAS